MTPFEATLRTYAPSLPGGFLECVPKLLGHFELLNQWNEIAGLVSPKSLQWAASKHYFDSAKIAYFCFEHRKNRPLFDLGSGGGFPGIIAAILGPQETVLFERSTKKRNFLITCQQELGLHNLRVEGEFLKKPDVPVLMSARAVSPLPVLLKGLSKKLMPGSSVVYPGTGPAKESDLPEPFRMIAESEYTLPGEGEKRSVTLLAR